MPTVNRPGRLLLAGIGAVVAAALSPAGLKSGMVPSWSWGVWAAVMGAALWMSGRAGIAPESGRQEPRL